MHCMGCACIKLYSLFLPACGPLLPKQMKQSFFDDHKMEGTPNITKVPGHHVMQMPMPMAPARPLPVTPHAQPTFAAPRPPQVPPPRPRNVPLPAVPQSSARQSNPGPVLKVDRDIRQFIMDMLAQSDDGRLPISQFVAELKKFPRFKARMEMPEFAPPGSQAVQGSGKSSIYLKFMSSDLVRLNGNHITRVPGHNVVQRPIAPERPLPATPHVQSTFAAPRIKYEAASVVVDEWPSWIQMQKLEIPKGAKEVAAPDMSMQWAACVVCALGPGEATFPTCGHCCVCNTCAASRRWMVCPTCGLASREAELQPQLG